jgi:tetratricopeptide (TPR) repeat protein
MGDVFAIQAEITSAIVDKLMPKLLGEQKARLTKRQPVDLEAYDSYLKGLYFQNKRSEMDLKKSIEYFERAIERDPNYALAYAGLALSYGILPIYSTSPPKEAVQKGREAALKALQIDDTLAEAHESLGLIKTRYDWDWERAEREYRRAIELNPGYAMAHQGYSFNLLLRGRFDEALKEMEQALDLDPVSAVVHYDLGTICALAGQFDRAINASKRALEMDPSLIYAHLNIGVAYRGKSMYEQALIEFRKEREVSKGAHAWAEVGIGSIYVQMGKPGEAQKLLDNLAKRSEREYVSPFILACLNFWLGKNNEGFVLLDQAHREQDHWLCWLRIATDLDSIRSDPNYITLLKKMNLDE